MTWGLLPPPRVPGRAPRPRFPLPGRATPHHPGASPPRTRMPSMSTEGRTTPPRSATKTASARGTAMPHGSVEEYAQQRRRVDDPANRLLREGQNGVEERRETARAYRRDSSRAQRLYERDNVSTRSVRAGEYTDDLRYDDGARPYDRASTISGRRSSRNIASVDRPNVRRRSEGQRGRIPGSSRGHGGQDRRTTLLVICALALALTLILVFSIRSCVSSRSTTSQESKTTVPVSTTSTDSSSSDTGSTDSSSTQTTTTTTDTTTSTDGSSTTDASSSDSSASTETVVTVSVAGGETSWLEMTNDDTSEDGEYGYGALGAELHRDRLHHHSAQAIPAWSPSPRTAPRRASTLGSLASGPSPSRGRQPPPTEARRIPRRVRHHGDLEHQHHGQLEHVWLDRRRTGSTTTSSTSSGTTGTTKSN